MADIKRFQDAFSSLEVSPDCIQEVLNMKSIQEVMKVTGLSETQIKLYIDYSLVHPKAEALKHLKAGALVGSEIEQLQAIQCLRIHEFGLEEIKVLKICGAHAKELLEEKTEEKRKPYTTMSDVLSAIQTLQRLAPEGKEREKLRNSLPRRLRNLAETPDGQKVKRNPFVEKYLPKLILLAILGIILVLFLLRLDGLPSRVIAVLVLICVASVISIGSGIWYLLRRKAPKQYSREGYGTIIKVTQDTRFDSSFAIGHSVVPGSGFSEQGRGGLWQFVFMFWNEIRPDNWYPLIRYQDGDTERIGSVRFGGFKHTWKQGDTIAIRWAERDDGTVYPADGSFFIKKGAIALVLGFLLMAIFARFIGPVFRTANSPLAPYATTLEEVLHGIPDEFVGNETISDREIQVDYTCFTGVREYTIHANEDDILYFETPTDLAHHAHPQNLLSILLTRKNKGIIGASIYAEKTADGTYLSAFNLDEEEYILTLSDYKGKGSFHLWLESERNVGDYAAELVQTYWNNEPHTVQCNLNENYFIRNAGTQTLQDINSDQMPELLTVLMDPDNFRNPAKLHNYIRADSWIRCTLTQDYIKELLEQGFLSQSVDYTDSDSTELYGNMDLSFDPKTNTLTNIRAYILLSDVIDKKEVTRNITIDLEVTK